MLDRETIPPLTVGLFVAVGVHLGAAAGYVAVSESEPARRPAAPRTDLAIGLLDVTPPRIAGRSADIVVRIDNRGERAAGPIRLDLAIDGRPIGSIHRDAVLASGGAFEQVFAHTVREPGVHEVRAIVDPDDEVAESDENNNRMASSFVWLAPTADREPLPDPAVYGIETGEPRIAGRPVRVVGRIANLGAATGGAVKLRLRVDGEVAAEKELGPAMSAGAVYDWAVRIVVEEPGEHELRVEVDPDQRLDEADEMNNVAARQFTWRRPQRKPKLGDETPAPLTMNWISYEDFRALRARRARFDQAMAQREVEPTPDAQRVPLEPTPAAAQTRASRSVTSPQTDPQPTAPRRVAEQAPQPQQPVQPQQPRDPRPAPPEQAPALERSEVETAAAAREAEVQPPARIAAAGEVAEAPAVVTDRTPSERPTPASIAEHVPSEQLALRTPPVDLPTGADPLTPDPSETAPSEQPDHRTPPVEVSEDAEPDARSREVEDEREGPVVAALPIPARPAEPPGSPQRESPTEPAEDTRAHQPQRPVDAERPPADGAQPQRDAERRTPEPADRPQPRPAEDSAADPTEAPRDDRESPPVSRSESVEIEPGEVLARQGVRVNTIRPRFSPVALRSSIPANPVVEVTFNDEGSVTLARIVRSSGYANVDGPLLASLYKWTASGEALERVRDGYVIRVRVLLRPE